MCKDAQQDRLHLRSPKRRADCNRPRYRGHPLVQQTEECSRERTVRPVPDQRGPEVTGHEVRRTPPLCRSREGGAPHRGDHCSCMPAYTIPAIVHHTPINTKIDLAPTPNQPLFSTPWFRASLVMIVPAT